MNILDNDKWIFLVPIDGNGNKNNIKTKNKSLKIEQPQKNQENLENQDNSKEEINQNSIINQNDTVKKNSDIKNKNDNKNNSKLYLYSFLSKSKELSIANSSKIYMSEFLKKNWKIKIKRLLIKLKKRYTKQAQKKDFEKPIETININRISEEKKNISKINDTDKSHFLLDDSLDFENKSDEINKLDEIKSNNDNYYNCNINNFNISNNQQNYYNYYIVNNNNNNNIDNNI